MLSDADIEEALLANHLSITPYDSRRLQPASYDLTLGNAYRVPNDAIGFRRLDCLAIRPEHTQLRDPRVDGQGAYIDLEPGDFILGTTEEIVRIPSDLVARVEGKSSIGRLGVIVHTTAGFIDPGFEGNITLELANVSPWVIRLRPGQRICQIAFTRLARPARDPYTFKGHYMNQIGPCESRFRMD